MPLKLNFLQFTKHFARASGELSYAPKASVFQNITKKVPAVKVLLAESFVSVDNTLLAKVDFGQHFISSN